MSRTEVGWPRLGYLDIDLNSLVKPAVVQAVDSWLDEDPRRREVTWVNDPVRPLRWAAADDPSARWSPTALRDAIFEAADVGSGSFSAADAWCHRGQNLYGIAADLLERDDIVESDPH